MELVNKDKVLSPWYPLEVYEDNGKYTVDVWGRSYIFDNTALPSQIISGGKNILSSQITITGKEDDQEIKWSLQGINSFEKTNEYVLLCGYMQSEMLVINTTVKIEYDGFMTLDLKLSRRGLSVPQVYGIEPPPTWEYNFSDLKFVVPMNPEISELFHYWPNTRIPDVGPVEFEEDKVATSGELNRRVAIPFKPVAWIGNEFAGLSWCCESPERWKFDDELCAIEMCGGENAALTLHLNDGLLTDWNDWFPYCYRFGLQATPVKPCDEHLGERRSLHIDCGQKIEGDYRDFFFSPSKEDPNETNLDRLVRYGINTLILHEKWNSVQNSFKLSDKVKREIKELVNAAHKRGIKVLPYFGFEISSLFPEFMDNVDEVIVKGKTFDPWYRQPPQRAYQVCYKSKWGKMLAEGIADIVDEFGFDGIYLDSTCAPRKCSNEKHGCGYRDSDGNLHRTYNVWATREMLKSLYSIIEPKHGTICVHTAGLIGSMFVTFSHIFWDGENLQYPFYTKCLDGIPLDYCRAQLFNNTGVPGEFLVYLNPKAPQWNFNKALSLTLPHAVLPKSNNIGEPLELLSGLYDIFNRYGTRGATFEPYWRNKISVDNQNVVCSYYIKSDVASKNRILLLCSNPNGKPADEVKIDLSSLNIGDKSIYNAQTGESYICKNGILTLSFEDFAYKILYIE